MTAPNREPSKALTQARAAEVGTLTSDQRRTVIEVAGLWTAEWSTLDKLPPQDLELAARLIVQAFPDFSPIEIMKYFAMLGGKFYETGEFWMHQAAQHPDYRGAELVTIKPGSDDWAEYLGERQEPVAIAAAVKCIARRAQRGAPERIETEASYVAIGDPIICDYGWQELGQGSRGDAEKRATELLGKDCAYEVIWKKARDGKAGEWLAKIIKLKPDAIALAFKKARTTATRRCLRRLFSLNEARVISTLAAVNGRLLEAAPKHHKFGQGDNPVDPWVEVPGAGGMRYRRGEEQRETLHDRTGDYGADARQTPRGKPQALCQGGPWDQKEIAADVSEVAMEGGHYALVSDENRILSFKWFPVARMPRATSTHDESEGRKATRVSEEDRRKLYRFIEGKDIGLLGVETGHEALHVLIREIRSLQPSAPVSTTDISYREFEELARRIEQLPPEKPAAQNPPPFELGAEGGAE